MMPEFTEKEVLPPSNEELQQKWKGFGPPRKIKALADFIISVRYDPLTYNLLREMVYHNLIGFPNEPWFEGTMTATSLITCLEKANQP